MTFLALFGKAAATRSGPPSWLEHGWLAGLSHCTSRGAARSVIPALPSFPHPALCCVLRCVQCTPPAVEDCLSDPAKACATCQAAPNALKCATCATAGWTVNAAGVVSRRSADCGTVAWLASACFLACLLAQSLAVRFDHLLTTASNDHLLMCTAHLLMCTAHSAAH